jgi:acetyl esterase/lipase
MNGPKGARELWVRGIVKPEINVFRPHRSNGSALLVFPGGGFDFLSVQNEGTNVARRFIASGFTVGVVSYRLPGEGWANRQRVPLQDAQRAVRVFRAYASRYGINPSGIGILGFSAGGFVAADLVTAYDEPCYQAVDEFDKMSGRPDFAGLIYPVASLEPGIGHKGTADRLLGPDAAPGELAKYSPARHVRPGMPPCFIAHAMDDATVPVEASFRLLDGCRRMKVPVEAHFFLNGGHGFGVRASEDLPAARWPELFQIWVASIGA